MRRRFDHANAASLRQCVINEFETRVQGLRLLPKCTYGRPRQHNIVEGYETANAADSFKIFRNRRFRVLGINERQIVIPFRDKLTGINPSEFASRKSSSVGVVIARPVHPVDPEATLVSPHCRAQIGIDDK